MGLGELTAAVWGLRAVLCACSICPLTIAGCFAGFYWTMWDEAKLYNEGASSTLVDFGDIDPYDYCGYATDGGVETNWSLIFAFNSIMYLAFCGGILLLILGTFFAPFWCCGCCTIMFGGCAHLAALIITGVFRFEQSGELCAQQTAPLCLDGCNTFQDHGETIKSLFIAQCVLYCLFGCCVGFMTGLSGQTAGMACANMFK